MERDAGMRDTWTLSDGHAGNVRQAQALAAALGALVADCERIARMGRAARARVERVFQWRDAAANLIQVFEETLHAAHRRPRAA